LRIQALAQSLFHGVKHSLDRQFLGFQGQLCLVGLPSKLLFGKRQKGLRVGAKGVGGGCLEGGVEVGLHLRVLGFFVSEPLLDSRQFFRLGSQRGDLGTRGFELFAQSGLTRLGQQTFAGQSLIELFLSGGTALAASDP
jgi:hypothetical protein